jgi:hypothetical protein
MMLLACGAEVHFSIIVGSNCGFSSFLPRLSPRTAISHGFLLLAISLFVYVFASLCVLVVDYGSVPW